MQIRISEKLNPDAGRARQHHAASEAGSRRVHYCRDEGVGIMEWQVGAADLAAVTQLSHTLRSAGACVRPGP